MGSCSPSPLLGCALGTAGLAAGQVKDEPRRPLPSPAKSEQQERLCGQASGDAGAGGGEQPQGVSETNFFPA